MAIRIANKRAAITPEFKEALRVIVKSRLKALHENIQSSNMHYQETLKKEKGPQIARLLSVLKEDAVPGKRLGMDYEVARLRALDYERFQIIEHNGYDYLAGVTNPIIATTYLQRHPSDPLTFGAQYDLGQYVVAFRVLHLEQANLEQMHLVPLRDKMVWARHFHHTAHSYGDPPDHPFDFEPHTCWGSFGGIATSLAQDGDIPELFRTMHLFLQRYDYYSPLASYGDMPWAKIL